MANYYPAFHYYTRQTRVKKYQRAERILQSVSENSTETPREGTPPTGETAFRCRSDRLTERLFKLSGASSGLLKHRTRRPETSRLLP